MNPILRVDTYDLLHEHMQFGVETAAFSMNQEVARDKTGTISDTMWKKYDPVSASATECAHTELRRCVWHDRDGEACCCSVVAGAGVVAVGPLAHNLTAAHACMQRQSEPTNISMKQLLKNVQMHLQTDLLGNMLEAFGTYPDKPQDDRVKNAMAQLLPDDIGERRAAELHVLVLLP